MDHSSLEQQLPSFTPLPPDIAQPSSRFNLSRLWLGIPLVLIIVVVIFLMGRKIIQKEKVLISATPTVIIHPSLAQPTPQPTSPLASVNSTQKPKVGFIPEQSDNITQLPKPGLATSIIMDFSKCSKGSEGVSFGFGSTHFAFEGILDSKCIFHYGTEIENPNWDGFLTTKCEVPINSSRKTYSVGDMGINMEELSLYCKQI